LAPGGLVALGEIGVGNTTVAAAMTAALLDLPPETVIGRGAGADTAMIERKTRVVAAALARATDRAPLEVLRALGGAEIATLTGVVLGAVAGGAGVVLDGLATSVAALVAARLEPAVVAHLVAGQRSREPGHAAVLVDLGLEPVLDLRIRTGEGVGAAMACQVVLTASALRTSTARTVEPLVRRCTASQPGS
ncbi:nicotinate-nucleotide--dimethylbenzimidazole phosphoribosyltransferase, partial [Kribbia dieselivorans]|uniref:nicotinate-nucleotide--dimethylbenzimidazole phosphoribosyltransferase n=1 Tax=Kribbia dieselivorans TaxID=331526 RepID=UPI000A76C2B1